MQPTVNGALARGFAGVAALGCVVFAASGFALNDPNATENPRDTGEGSSGAAHLQVPLVPLASDPGIQGFVRIINHDTQSGAVRIQPIDDEGWRPEPLTLTIGPRETAHFNSHDLEFGNAAKRLDGAAGPGSGAWRLEFESHLDIEVLAYIRTRDGFLTTMHELAPRTPEGLLLLTFNPGDNPNQRSTLRLINPGSETADVVIVGTDDTGQSPDDGVQLSLPPGTARSYTARQLESGAGGLTGALGNGVGKWRLLVSSAQRVQAMSLLHSPTGHLSNLSAGWTNARTGVHRVPVFPAAGDPEGRAGFLRVINRGTEVDHLSVSAYDRYNNGYGGPVLRIESGHSIHFNSSDLEFGNPDKGFSRGIGPTNEGTGWLLELQGSIDTDVIAYIRTEDGFVTPIGDVAANDGNYLRIPTFNPGRNLDQRSSLRLINDSESTQRVTITGVDDRGRVSSDDAQVLLYKKRSKTFEARELEMGAPGLDGKIGSGTGKWQLFVAGEPGLRAVSLLSSPTGHLSNLSSNSVAVEAAPPERGLETGFSPPARIDSQVYPNDLATADLDGDGDLDMLAVSGDRTRESDPILWYENLGDGAFSERRILVAGVVRAESLATADLDGDGDLDVLFTSGAGHGFAWVENLGGFFGAPVTISSRILIKSSAESAMDLDGDGDLDLVAGTEYDAELLWFENLGGAEFGEARSITREIESPYSIRGLDLDSDGDPDILVASWEAGLAWIENLGNGSFAEPRVLATEPMSEVRAGDLDGDGDLDLIATWLGEYHDYTATGTGTLSWYENLGGGIISEQRLIGQNLHSVGSAFPADLDGDGDLDVYSLWDRGEVLSWYENYGNGEFSAQRTVQTGAGGSGSVAVADFDGDGNLDILSGARVGGEVVWLRNLGKVGAPTAPPPDLEVQAEIGRLWVSWGPLSGAGTGGSPVTEYLATAIPQDGGDSKSCTATIATSCTIVWLTPGTVYEVTVAARNGVGWGPNSHKR